MVFKVAVRLFKLSVVVISISCVSLVFMSVIILIQNAEDSILPSHGLETSFFIGFKSTSYVNGFINYFRVFSHFKANAIHSNN